MKNPSKWITIGGLTVLMAGVFFSYQNFSSTNIKPLVNQRMSNEKQEFLRNSQIEALKRASKPTSPFEIEIQKEPGSRPGEWRLRGMIKANVNVENVNLQWNLEPSSKSIAGQEHINLNSLAEGEIYTAEITLQADAKSSSNAHLHAYFNDNGESRGSVGHISLSETADRATALSFKAKTARKNLVQ